MKKNEMQVLNNDVVIPQIGFTKKHNALVNESMFAEALVSFANRELFDNELPPVIINMENTKGAYGYASTHQRYELNGVAYYQVALNPVLLVSKDKGLVPMIDTVLHEAIHLYCRVKGIQEVSNGNRYHNKKFKELCDKIGLKTEKMPVVGYNTVNELSPELVAKIMNDKQLVDLAKNIIQINDISKMSFEDILNSLGSMFTGLGQSGQKLSGSKNTNLQSYKCPVCGLKARARKNAHLVCGDCMVDLE